MCLTMLSAAWSSEPEENSTLRAEAENTVIVPYDGTRAIKGQTPAQLYVPYEQFLKLWEKTKENRKPVMPVPADRPFALSTARYEGQIEAERVTLTATIELSTYNSDWVS